MHIKITDDPTLAEGSFKLIGCKDGELLLNFTSEVCPALAIWKQMGELFPVKSDTPLSAAVRSDCHYFQFHLALFVAEMLAKLISGWSVTPYTSGKTVLEELGEQTQHIIAGGFADERKLGYGLAQLVSYAQREWTGAFVACPLEQRITSLYIAILRTCGEDEDERRGWIQVFFEYTLRILYPDIAAQKEIQALRLHAVKISRTMPACPTLEGVFEGAKFDSQFWLLSLVERLKHDRKAYQQDICRAKKEYAALEDTMGIHRPVECVRISDPKSLMFDLWAWSDYCGSCEKAGFPLVWIDHGWGHNGFELRLDPSRRGSFKPLVMQSALNLGTLPRKPEECGWSLRYDGGLASDVRFALKKGLFFDDSIKYEDIFCSSNVECASSLDINTIPIETAIRDSEVSLPATIPISYTIKENHYRWAQITYSKYVDIYQTWAGDEIARSLYSVLRTDEKMQLPNNFLTEHVQREPGLVSVWTRDGLAIGIEEDCTRAVEAGKQLRQRLCDAAKLEGSITALIKPEIPHQEPCGEVETRKEIQIKSRNVAVMDLTDLHLKLRHEIAKPEFRPIRRFVERLHGQEVYDAFRESEADKRQARTLKRQGKTLTLMREASEKIDWLEIAIFTVYITEASHILGEGADVPKMLSLWITVIASLAGFGLGLTLLRRKKGKRARSAQDKWSKWAKYLLFFLVIALYSGHFLLSFHYRKDNEHSPRLTSDQSLPAHQPAQDIPGIVEPSKPEPTLSTSKGHPANKEPASGIEKPPAAASPSKSSPPVSKRDFAARTSPKQ